MSEKTLRVTAAAGTRFPLEEDSKKYITAEPVTVASSPYYRRAVSFGDLIIAAEKKEPAKQQLKKGADHESDPV